MIAQLGPVWNAATTRSIATNRIQQGMLGWYLVREQTHQ